MYKTLHYNNFYGDFSGGPAVRTLRFHCRGPGSVPGWGLRSCKSHSTAKKKEQFLCPPWVGVGRGVLVVNKVSKTFFKNHQYSKYVTVPMFPYWELRVSLTAPTLFTFVFLSL